MENQMNPDQIEMLFGKRERSRTPLTLYNSTEGCLALLSFNLFIPYLTLLNTLCNMSNEAVQADQHRIDVQEAQSHAAASDPQQPPLIQQSINPLVCSSADSSPVKPNQGAEDNLGPYGAPCSDLIASAVGRGA
jgi:hypothetical protein